MAGERGAARSGVWLSRRSWPPGANGPRRLLRYVSQISTALALAHAGNSAPLGLARAYALQGDTARARSSYQRFLTLWKDADPDIPILKEAKAEYAKPQ